jgi:hypothetical protein
MFVEQDRLQLIFGDLFRSVVAPEFYHSPIAERQIDRRLHPHEPGTRAQETLHEGLEFDPAPGIELRARSDGVRQDWLMLDVAAMTCPCALGDPACGRGSREDGAASAEERLSRLKRLYEQGLITPDEYERKRREILAPL